MSFFSEQSLPVDAQLSFAYQLIIIKELKEENCSLKTENRNLQEKIARLKEQLSLSKHQRFGKKSEVGESVSNTDKSSFINVKAHPRNKKQKAG